MQAYTETLRNTGTGLSSLPFLVYLLGHLMRVMQRVLSLQEHALLLAAGQTARQPRGQGAAADPQTGQRHGGHVQRTHRVRTLHQRPHKLEVQDSSDQAANTAC